MARFILIDHSLTKIGGHHFDYALHVARAAERLGFEIVLATHRKFRPGDEISTDWRVLPLFRYGAYSQHAVFQNMPYRWNELDAGAQAKPYWRTVYDTLKGRVSAIGRQLGIGGREQRIRQFARSCKRLFEEVSLSPHDQVFLPTLSEFDLEGLVRFLRSEPASRDVPWHLQFHFNLVSGREPDYSAQLPALQVMRDHFRGLLEQVPEHSLHFYNTSEPLARQYNRLAVGTFENLTYPINQAFAPREARLDNGDAAPSSRPLRITSAGALRREKGIDFLSRIMHELWEPYFACGKAEFCVQSNKDWFQMTLPEQADPEQPVPVRYVDHPLSMEPYRDFICDADIGLLIYDPDRYYARRAGVLGEFLAAGVPVIVPAGCWLSQQVAESNFAHADDVVQQWRRQGEASVLSELPSGEEAPRRISLEDGRRATFRFTLPANSRQAMLRFAWRQPTEPGTYVRLQCRPIDRQGNVSGRELHILGRREGERSAEQGVLIGLRPSTAALEIELSNAYQTNDVLLDRVEMSVWRPGFAGAEAAPSGAVGLIAAEPDQYGRLLSEMLTHHAHYRATAVAHAAQWARLHAPARTVSDLLHRAAGPAAIRRAA